MLNYTGIKNEVCIEVLCNSNVVVGHYGLTAHILGKIIWLMLPHTLVHSRPFNIQFHDLNSPIEISSEV